MAYKSFRSGKVGKWYRKNRKVRRGKSRAFPRTRTIRTPNALKQTIRTMIARATEGKKAEFINLDKPLQGTANAANFDATNVIPLGCQAGAFEIEQGVGMSQRSGNKITIKKATIKGTIHANLYNATTNPTPKPTQIKMVLFYDKKNPTTTPTPAASADILDFDNGTQGFHNDLVDMWASFNTERYRVLKTKMFKIGWSTNLLNGAGANGSANFNNNDFKMNGNFNIDYTKYLPKTMVFEDNDIDSTTRQLYCMWILCDATGGGIFANVSQVSVQYQGSLVYSDA